MNQRLSILLLYVIALAAAGCRDEKQKGDAAVAHGKQGSEAKSKSSEERSSGPKRPSDQKESSVPADTVRIAREEQLRAGIRVGAVVFNSTPQRLTVNGQVVMDEKHTEHIGALADGRIENVYVLPGDAIRRGQTLATLHSHTVHETVAALMQAFAAETRQQSALSFAVQVHDRYSKLYSIQAASLEESQRSEQEVAQARKDLSDAQANVHAEREHLAELLQVAPASLRPDTIYKRELIPVRAVADGVVITRSVTPGQVVAMGAETFVTTNLSTVWVNAAVNERDLREVYVGKFASISTPGTSASGMRGKVMKLADVVDPLTRTLPVRLTVSNPGLRLRPGMFVTASIDEPSTRTAVFVTNNALQDVNGFHVVFVTSDGITFQARAVTTGAEINGLVEIVEGLQPTDHVAVEGAFIVKSELLKGTVGES